MHKTIGLVAAVVAVGVFAGGASAAYDPAWTYTEGWEMNVDMTQAGSGEVLGANMVVPGGAGSGTYGPDGFEYAGGIATFLDNASSSGNQGIMIASDLLDGGYIVDMRIRWLSGCGGNGSQKSMGFAGEGGVGRGLRLDDGWIHSVSSGVTASGGVVTNDWLDLRVVVQNTGIWAAYVGTTGNLILQSPDAGSTPTSFLGNSGFFLGSWGGSSTTDCKYELDYVRVGLGHTNDPTYDFTPEPTALALLALGAVPMLRRRR